MTTDEAARRVNAASDELLAVHDSIKTVGVRADFPYPHDWNAYAVVDLLDTAHRAAAEAARLLSKVTAAAVIVGEGDDDA